MLQFDLIGSFRHRGLKRLYEHDDGAKIRADQLSRVRDVLAHLDRAQVPADLDSPGYRFHPLKGNRKSDWSVRISGNWRIIFRFKDGDAFEVDLADYH